MPSGLLCLTPMSDAFTRRTGPLANVSARVIWGAATFYFGLSASDDGLRVFEQRVLWAFIFLCAIATVSGAWGAVGRALADPVTASRTALAALCIATNWFVVIWCSKNGQLVPAGIGFFVAPLLMILAGALLFAERNLRDIALSLVLCSLGVALYFQGSIAFPWPVFAVALSTTAYTLLRKKYPLATMTANVLEAGFALFATTLLILLLRGPADLLPPPENHLAYYVGLGVITSAPMVLYVYSLAHVSLTLVGYFQYVTPTIMMAVALASGEGVKMLQIAGLGLIWVAAAIYLVQQGSKQGGAR